MYPLFSTQVDEVPLSIAEFVYSYSENENGDQGCHKTHVAHILT